MDKFDITKKNEEWVLKKEGAERAIKKSDTKEAAVKHMREYMADKVGSVRIHKQDGAIQEERTYQRVNDPKKSKG